MLLLLHLFTFLALQFKIFRRCLQLLLSSLDEKSNLQRVGHVQTCCKYQRCKGLHPLHKWWLPSLHNWATTTLCNGCISVQSRNLQQVCTRQTLCKFDFSSNVVVFKKAFTSNLPPQRRRSSLKILTFLSPL